MAVAALPLVQHFYIGDDSGSPVRPSSQSAPQTPVLGFSSPPDGCGSPVSIYDFGVPTFSMASPCKRAVSPLSTSGAVGLFDAEMEPPLGSQSPLLAAQVPGDALRGVACASAPAPSPRSFPRSTPPPSPRPLAAIAAPLSVATASEAGAFANSGSGPLALTTERSFSEGSGARVLRRGRFTVKLNEDPEAASLDDAAHSASPLGSASRASQEPWAERQEGLNVHDVRSFLESKLQQVAQLFLNFRSEIAQVIAGPAGGASGEPVPSLFAAAHPSCSEGTPQLASTPWQSSSCAPSAASTRSTSPSALRLRQRVSLGNTGARSASQASALNQTGNCSQMHTPISVLAPQQIAGQRKETDEAMVMWEALAKPVERATRRNRELVDENKRLRKAIAAMRSELEVQHRRMAAGEVPGAAAVATGGRFRG